jgi:hypothetical protein
MTFLIAPQQKSPFQSLAEIPPSTSPIKKLNRDLIRSICNYIKPQEVAKIVHLVCKAWHTLLPNDGILDLRNSKIKGQDLSRLIENYIVGAKLHSLDLSRCDHVGDEEMAYLGGFPSTRLNFQLQEKYQKNLRLEKLIFSDCSKITVSGIKQLSTLSITHLDLSVNLWMSDKAVGYLTALPLTTLLIDRTAISDQGMQHLARCSSLTSLNLPDCFEITDSGVEAIRHLNLRELNLDECNISDLSLQHLARCSSLRSLSLSQCAKITDEGIKAIRHLKLTLLDLAETQVSDHCLENLANFPLRSLNLYQCKITEEACENLKARFSDRLIDFEAVS